MASASGGVPAAATPPTATAVDLSHRTRRRRRCLIVILAVLLATAAVLVILFLTVLRIGRPTMRVVSTHLVGVNPRLTILPPSFELNVTVLLTVAVHNPNPASFSYASGGHAELSYRGTHVGDAEIFPGAVPSRGDADMDIALQLQAARIAGGIPRLVMDVVKNGTLPLDTSATVPGTVTFFGVFRRDVVARSECSFVFGVAEMRVQSQECRSHAV